LLVIGFATRSWSRPSAAEVQTRVQIPLVDPLVIELAEQTERLRRSMARATVASPGDRDIFAGSGARPPARATTPVELPTWPLAIAPDTSPPPLTLEGIAENAGRGTLERTAVISGAAGELFLVKPSDEIGGRYRLGAVGPDRAEIVDVASGRTFLLTLK
jgi:hypothetical protein